jgi:hypothetical protein
VLSTFTGRTVPSILVSGQEPEDKPPRFLGEHNKFGTQTSEILTKTRNRTCILHNQLKMASTTTVLIVGANRGLGLQFALQYPKKGFNVYSTYRKESAAEAKEVCFEITRFPLQTRAHSCPLPVVGIWSHHYPPQPWRRGFSPRCSQSLR